MIFTQAKTSRSMNSEKQGRDQYSTINCKSKIPWNIVATLFVDCSINYLVTMCCKIFSKGSFSAASFKMSCMVSRPAVLQHEYVTTVLRDDAKNGWHHEYWIAKDYVSWESEIPCNINYCHSFALYCMTHYVTLLQSTCSFSKPSTGCLIV